MKYRAEEAAFAQTILKIDGVEYNCRAKGYGDNMEFSDVEGASQMPTGRTRGMYRTDETEIELHASDFAELQDKFGADFYSKEFTITNTYEKLGDSKLTQDELMKVRFRSRAAADESGPDALTRTVGIKPLFIRWNGKDPLNPMPKGLK